MNEISIQELIDRAECTNLSDLESIAKKEEYRQIIQLGEDVIPYLIKRNNILWDIALKEITGEGLNSFNFTTKERVDYWQNWYINKNKYNTYD